MTTTTTSTFDAEQLRTDTVDTQSVHRDWSRGFAESWAVVAVMVCGECESPASPLDTEIQAIWSQAATLLPAGSPAEAARLFEQGEMPEWASDWDEHGVTLEVPGGCCPNPTCSQFREECEDTDSDGPMMNYYYPLPDGREYDEDDARRLLHLPLCIVRLLDDEDGGTDGYALALTGGGMDLSWEICDAFIQLGFLPPLAYCDLPAMAGRPRGHDLEIMAACKRTAEVVAFRAGRVGQRVDDLLLRGPAFTIGYGDGDSYGVRRGYGNQGDQWEVPPPLTRETAEASCRELNLRAATEA